jgi:hypothetical protein
MLGLEIIRRRIRYGRGVVLGRAVATLRFVETHPLAWRICLVGESSLGLCAVTARSSRTMAKLRSATVRTSSRTLALPIALKAVPPPTTFSITSYTDIRVSPPPEGENGVSTPIATNAVRTSMPAKTKQAPADRSLAGIPSRVPRLHSNSIRSLVPVFHLRI